MRFRMILLGSVLAVAVGACGGERGSAAPAAPAPVPVASDRSLYDRLGGQDAITAVVADFVANVVADARINAFFANANAEELEAKLVDQICEATGGPCTYTGKSMKESHAGMGVQDEHFTAMVEDLVRSLDKFGVKDPEKTELLTALAGMKPDIVTPSAAQ